MMSNLETGPQYPAKGGSKITGDLARGLAGSGVVSGHVTDPPVGLVSNQAGSAGKVTGTNDTILTKTETKTETVPKRVPAPEALVPGAGAFEGTTAPRGVPATDTLVSGACPLEGVTPTAPQGLFASGILMSGADVSYVGLTKTLHPMGLLAPGTSTPGADTPTGKSNTPMVAVATGALALDVAVADRRRFKPFYELSQLTFTVTDRVVGGPRVWKRLRGSLTLSRIP